MELSKRIGGLKGSATLAITSEVGRLKAEGRQVFSFTAGQLDFPTPDYIKKEAIKAIEENFTLYTPVAGTPELRKEIAAWTKDRTGIEYHPDNVLVSCGAKQSLYNVMQAVLQEGDECIIFAPYWLSYPEMIKSTGAEPVVVQTIAENGFVPDIADLEAALTDRTKAIILNSPQNPTGAVYPPAFFDAAGRLLAGRDILCISDEIYSEITTGDIRHQSIAAQPGMMDKTVMINGVSKTFAMTGWRIGWAMGPADVIDAAKRLQAHSTSNPCSISQKASVAALDRPQAEAFIAKVGESIARRKVLALSILRKSPRIDAVEPEGAFYIMIDVRKLLADRFPDSAELCKYLLSEHGIAFIPGDVFGIPGFIRMSIATDDSTIERGLSRFIEVIEEF